MLPLAFAFALTALLLSRLTGSSLLAHCFASLLAEVACGLRLVVAINDI
jgi:hypothetical protein